MSCPICHRIYCDHTAEERGQTNEQMMADIYAPSNVIVQPSTPNEGLEETIEKSIE